MLHEEVVSWPANLESRYEVFGSLGITVANIIKTQTLRSAIQFGSSVPKCFMKHNNLISIASWVTPRSPEVFSIEGSECRLLQRNKKYNSRSDSGLNLSIQFVVVAENHRNEVGKWFWWYPKIWPVCDKSWKKLGLGFWIYIGKNDRVHLESGENSIWPNFQSFKYFFTRFFL